MIGLSRKKKGAFIIQADYSFNLKYRILVCIFLFARDIVQLDTKIYENI